MRNKLFFKTGATGLPLSSFRKNYPSLSGSHQGIGISRMSLNRKPDNGFIETKHLPNAFGFV
jgi:hypothetical protein